LSGFNGFTETKEVNEDVYSINSVKNLDGSYRLGVEVHYMDEVTTLRSIKYFDTYFVFSKYIDLLLYRYPTVILSLYYNQY
jgi:hypothetical protein